MVTQTSTAAWLPPVWPPRCVLVVVLPVVVVGFAVADTAAVLLVAEVVSLDERLDGERLYPN